MTRKVIDHKYLPTRLPIVGTAVWLHLLNYYNAPGWAWGVSGTILTVFWIVAIVALVTQKTVKPSEVE